MNGDQQRSKKKRKKEGDHQHPVATASIRQPIDSHPLGNGMSQGAKPGSVKADSGSIQQGQREKGTVKQKNNMDGSSLPGREAAVKKEDKSGTHMNGAAKESEIESLGTLSQKQKKKAKRKALNGVAPS